MQVLIAADKFKNSLTSIGVCRAIEAGLAAAVPGIKIMSLPLADGGDGLAETLAYYAPFEKISCRVYDPLWELIDAYFLFSRHDRLTFIEMAQASGLHLLQPSAYNCARTTTYGTGQLIKKAVEAGAKKLVIGIGGSATNDCGMGMAAALGYQFLDASGKPLSPIGENLMQVQAIDRRKAISLEGIDVQVACDVTNYLTGPEGATRMYGPQKGATPAMIENLEAGMLHFAAVVKRQLGMDVEAIKGGGAAGGMGAGCCAFLGARIISGAELLFAYSKAEKHIQEADIVITGEGKIDNQTWNGKLVHSVAQLCRQYNKPLLALCGTLEASPETLSAHGIRAAFSIVPKPMPHEEALAQAPVLLYQTAYAVGGLLRQ